MLLSIALALAISGNPASPYQLAQYGQPTNPAPLAGRYRNGQFIPTCPVGQGFSIEHQQCIPASQIGGIIPCSADDVTFDPRTGRMVPNCR
jgi:hypothetical protein